MKPVLHIAVFLACLLLASCSVLEKASSHGFERGDYTLKQAGAPKRTVYAESSEQGIRVYDRGKEEVKSQPILDIPLGMQDSICRFPLSFIKQSLDIDITSVLFKVRPQTAGIPLQMTTDFNAALYAGWRHDTYRVHSLGTPLGQCEYRVINRGFDLGAFVGLGATPIDPFVTRDQVSREYSAMIVEYGLAGFLESSVASFGLAFGFDHVLGPDRRHWIYRNKPWLGFVIGIALN